MYQVHGQTSDCLYLFLLYFVLSFLFSVCFLVSVIGIPTRLGTSLEHLPGVGLVGEDKMTIQFHSYEYTGKKRRDQVIKSSSRMDVEFTSFLRVTPIRFLRFSFFYGLDVLDLERPNPPSVCCAPRIHQAVCIPFSSQSPLSVLTVSQQGELRKRNQKHRKAMQRATFSCAVMAFGLETPGESPSKKHPKTAIFFGVNNEMKSTKKTRSTTRSTAQVLPVAESGADGQSLGRRGS